MRKLKLDVDNLSVESFHTARFTGARNGTVYAAGTNDPLTVVTADTGVTCGDSGGGGSSTEPTGDCFSYTNEAPSTCCYVFTVQGC